MNKLTYTEGIFFSKWFSKFINNCFRLRNKIIAEKILYQIFFLVKKKLNFSCLFFFFETLEKVKPVVGLKVFTVGKNKTKAIPIFLHVGLQYKKAMV
jgi:ribosomal protein S7